MTHGNIVGSAEVEFFYKKRFIKTYIYLLGTDTERIIKRRIARLIFRNGGGTKLFKTISITNKFHKDTPCGKIDSEVQII